MGPGSLMDPLWCYKVAREALERMKADGWTMKEDGSPGMVPPPKPEPAPPQKSDRRKAIEEQKRKKDAEE